MNRFELISSWTRGEPVPVRDLVAALRVIADELEQQGGDVVRTQPVGRDGFTARPVPPFD